MLNLDGGKTLPELMAQLKKLAAKSSANWQVIAARLEQAAVSLRRVGQLQKVAAAAQLRKVAADKAAAADEAIEGEIRDLDDLAAYGVGVDRAAIVQKAASLRTNLSFRDVLRHPRTK